MDHVKSQIDATFFLPSILNLIIISISFLKCIVLNIYLLQNR